MNKLQLIEEMEKQLAALRAEVGQEAKPKQWEPKGGRWVVHSNGGLVNAGNCGTSKERRLFGTMRSTQDQAAKSRDEMRVFNRLLAYRDEFDPEFVEVWNGIIANYFICYNIHTEKYEMDGNSIYKGVGVVYMSQEVATDLARKLNSGEVVL